MFFDQSIFSFYLQTYQLMSKALESALSKAVEAMRVGLVQHETSGCRAAGFHTLGSQIGELDVLSNTTDTSGPVLVRTQTLEILTRTAYLCRRTQDENYNNGQLEKEVTKCIGTI